MVAEGGEGENPLPFSLAAPKPGGGGGGGVGGVSRLVSLQVPTSEAAQKVWVVFVGRPLGGPFPNPWGPEGPKFPGDLAHRPLGPGSRHFL